MFLNRRALPFLLGEFVNSQPEGSRSPAADFLARFLARLVTVRDETCCLSAEFASVIS